MKPKALLTTVVLGGLLLAACKPGQAAGLNLPTGAVVVQTEDGTRTGATTGDDNSNRNGTPGHDDLTGTPEAGQTETEHPNSDDSSASIFGTGTPDGHQGHGQNGSDDNGTHTPDDNGTHTPDNHGTHTPNATDNRSGDDRGTHTPEPEHTQQAEVQGSPVPGASKVEFTGTIDSIGNGFIVVAGQTIWLGAASQITGSLTAGSVVKVEATVDANGAIIAAEIKVSGSAGSATSVSGADDNGTHTAPDDSGNHGGTPAPDNSGGTSAPDNHGGGNSGGGSGSGGDSGSGGSNGSGHGGGG